MPVKPGAPQRKRLRTALKAGFRLIQQDTDGPPSALEDVRTTYNQIDVAWRDCPEAAEVYAQECEAWRKATGRDPLTGRPLAEGVPA